MKDITVIQNLVKKNTRDKSNTNGQATPSESERESDAYFHFSLKWVQYQIKK